MSMTMGWPCLKYPTSGDQEGETLDKIRSTVKNNAVGAVIVEPVNWQTGAVMSSHLIDQIG